MIFEWVRIHETALWWIGTLSMATLIGTLIVIPILVVRIPANYFRRERQNPDSCFRAKHPITCLIGFVLKNLLGIIFVLAGFAMLLLPGQGFITILIGVMLLNFPGKFALERRIVQQRAVLRAINWMRAKANQPVLQVLESGPAVEGDDRDKD